VDSN